MKYYLLDLERSFQSNGQMYFWKQSRHGYTTDFLSGEVGLFSEDTAKQIVEDDFDQKTVMISEKVVERILDRK